MDHVADYKLDREFCPDQDFLKCLEGKWRSGPGEVTVLQAGGDGICKMARLLADAPHPYIYITPAENWGAVSSQSFNRTANWNYWTDPRQCLEERDRGVMTASSPDYLYAIISTS